MTGDWMEFPMSVFPRHGHRFEFQVLAKSFDVIGYNIEKPFIFPVLCHIGGFSITGITCNKHQIHQLFLFYIV